MNDKKDRLRYAVVGTGAIGGYYGMKLAKSRQEVHFLLHSDYEYVKRFGLKVVSPTDSMRIRYPKVYKDTQDMPQCDVVIVALKTVRNHLLPQLLPPLLHPRTLVILIQNGIGVEEDVQKMLPGTWLAAGLAFICSAKVGFGLIHHQDFGSINLANYSCPDKELMDRVLADFRKAKIEANEVEYLEARWRKAVWNMPFNGLTVALNTETNKLLADPSTRQLVRDMMMEVINAARALGVKNLDESFADKMIETTDRMTPYSPSMKLDFERRQRMETYYIYTRPRAYATAAGSPMPRLEMLEQILLYKEKNDQPLPVI